MHATLPHLETSDFPAIRRTELETLQVNLGYRCNQQCQHCHVNAGPKRQESMVRETIDALLALLANGGIKRLDLTGGAPEMNPHFRHLVSEARRLGVHVIDRCNLTILSEPGYEDLAPFLANHQVEVVASLPCYLEENVDQQRGKGTFRRSIEGLRQLNRHGYAEDELTLNLMYNPQGAVLPPAQQQLESAYRQHLEREYGIRFSHLYTLTNMPIQRFGSTLISRGEFDDYMQLLRDNFKEENLNSVMCRSLISVDWQGYLYDCDFNQMLNLPAPLGDGGKAHISTLEGRSLVGREIVVKGHCYGCTAGQGSSCSGTLA